MNDRDLKNAFPPTPEMCRNALVTAVSSAQEERNMKRTLRLAALLAVMILTLTSAAYAVTRPPVLDWLLGRGSAGIWLENAAQSVDGLTASDGVTIAITSLVYDGERLVLSYEASVDDPTQAVMVAPDRVITLNGAEAAMDWLSVEELRMVPSPHLDFLPVARNPIRAGAWSEALPELSGMVEAELDFLICRPETAFAIVDEDGELSADLSDLDEETRAEHQDRLNTLAALTNAVITKDLPDGYTPVTVSGSLIEGEEPHLIETRLTVRFRFSADEPMVRDFSETADIALADATARVNIFRLSPLSTRAQVDLLPRENTEEAARLLRDAYGPALLTDEDGHEVVYADMDYMASHDPLILQTDGQWRCRYDIDMPGLQTLPESIGLTAAPGDLLRFPLLWP